MQEIQATQFSFFSVAQKSIFGGAPEIQVEQVSGRSHVRYLKDGKVRIATVRAQEGWEIHILEEDSITFSCAFDEGRESICVERFEHGQIPQVRLLEGADRQAVLGAGFETIEPAAIAAAVDQSGYD